MLRIFTCIFLFGYCFAMSVCFTEAFEQPELPRVYIDTTYVEPPGTVISVSAGGDFQQALDIAQPGDIIELEAGATFAPRTYGAFVLKRKINPNNKWIYIRSTDYTNLPPCGTRVGKGCEDDSCSNLLSDKAHMAILERNEGPILEAEYGAQYYRLIGLEIRAKSNWAAYGGALVKLGNNAMTIGLEFPHHIFIDRCYIHSNGKEVRRGVEFHGEYMAAIDSYISNFFNSEAQSIWGNNGPGPYKISNNFLEGSGENIMFGGAAIAYYGNISSDIEIERNHFFKRLEWKTNQPASTSIKNHLEFKNAQRVLVNGNEFENCWTAAGDTQNGLAIQMTPRCEASDGVCRFPWVQVRDITITNNIFHNLGMGFNIGAGDFGQVIGQSEPTHIVKVNNNLFYDIFQEWHSWKPGNGFMLGRGVHDIAVNHATIILDYDAPIWFETVGFLAKDVHVTNSILTNPIDGSGCSNANTCIGENMVDPANDWLSEYDVWVRVSPTGNDGYCGNNCYFPSTLNDVGFVDYVNDDYYLTPSSQYKRAASDGKDIGADIEAINTAITGGTGYPLTGDLNEDGYVNVQDVQSCVQHILGTQDWGSPADVNGDESVNVTDTQEIVNIILGVNRL
ncbi:MAG: dockerin type I repeat-containing protein [bacterium]